MTPVKSIAERPAEHMESRAAKVVLASLGAREHYEPAAMLHRHGNLTKLITDFWAPAIPRALGKLLPRNISRIAGRRRSDIPGNLVRSLSGFDSGYTACRCPASRVDRSTA